MNNKNELLESNRDYIVEQYNSPNITQAKIAKNIGVDPSTLTRFANSLGLVKTVKTKMTEEHKEWLKDNYHLTYSEMSNHVKCCPEVIRTTLISMGIVRKAPYRPFKLDMSDKEFLKDLDDPRLCAPDIVRKYKDKYGIGDSRIHQLRKQRGIKLQINTMGRESVLERRVREILEKLDIPFTKEKRFGKYSVDFYLGYKISLEVQGDYWHSIPERIKTDRRKKAYLESLGHTVLVIWEKDVSSAEEYLLTTLKKLGFPTQRCVDK